MTPRLLGSLVGLLLLGIASAPAILACGPEMSIARANRGEWSASGTLWNAGNGTQVKLVSPDVEKTALVAGVALVVRQHGNQLGNEVPILPVAELQWSPDSGAIAVTESDGGSVGTWSATVYVLSGAELKTVELRTEIEKRFTNYHCEPREALNVAVVGWKLGDVLVIAEVPPHSSCRDMGTIRGYRMELPSGRIVEELDERSARESWQAHFGDRLRR